MKLSKFRKLIEEIWKDHGDMDVEMYSPMFESTADVEGVYYVEDYDFANASKKRPTLLIEGEE